MKTTLSFLSIFLMSIGLSYAQPNFTFADHPNIGDVGAYNHNPGYTPTGSLDTQTGNNYTWDFSSLTFTQPFWAVDSFRVKTLPVSNNFPNATMEYYHSEAGGAHMELYSYSNDTLFLHRYGSPLNGQGYVPKIASIKFPIAFNGKSLITDTVFQGSSILGIRTTEVLYDGFGTLNLIDGVNYNNVFRVKKVETDSSFLTESVVIYTNYIWYSQGGGAPLFRLYKVDFGTPSGNNYSAYSIKDATTSVSENNMELDPNILVYPNPADNIIQLKGIANDQPYTIYNVKGGEMKKGKVSADNKIHIQGFPSGTYFLQVGEQSVIQFVKE